MLNQVCKQKCCGRKSIQGVFEVDLREATVRNFKRELEKQIKSGKRYDEA